MLLKNKKLNLVFAIFLITISLLLGGSTIYLYLGKPQDTSQNITEKIEPQPEPNIHVFKPKPGDTVGLPLKILGEARVFENQFNVRIRDANGKIIKEIGVMAEGDGEVGEFNLFSKEINYNKPETPTGTIEFFDYSAKDGSEIDKVIIPVKFETVYNAINVQAFFGNAEKNPNAEDCAKVYPLTRRIPYTKNTAEFAIKELLDGLSKEEAEKGYFTSINSGVKLNKISVKNSTAFVDFDETLQSGVGGSCRVSQIRAQITETLKQFPGISTVEISINERVEDILQP